eukprot:SM000096S24902  [mRNA]  locus=s96:479955:482667:+ [translate_table: standard]
MQARELLRAGGVTVLGPQVQQGARTQPYPEAAQAGELAAGAAARVTLPKAGEDDDEAADLEALNYDDLDAHAKLQSSARFLSTLRRVEASLAGDGHGGGGGGGAAAEDGGQEEYALIVECTALAGEMEAEAGIIHAFVRDKYRPKFPELESLVLHPVDYARVVRAIGNETDLTLVDLEGLLPSATIMVVSVTASTTSGKPLAPEALAKALAACDRALALDEARRRLLAFVEARMGRIAPSLSAVVGSAVAARLMGTAGGLAALARMPACNVQVLGAKRNALSGFSTATALPHTGFVFHAEVVQSCPPPLRLRACRLVAGKCTLAARVDATRADLDGAQGRRMREEIAKKIEKWQEPPPPKQPKPLPVPDSDPKKKRGGRRLRKMKERYAMTDMRKQANRMQFGVAEESTLGDGIGEGRNAGPGRQWEAAAEHGPDQAGLQSRKELLLLRACRRDIVLMHRLIHICRFKEKSYGSSGGTSGLSSSLAFTPVQGIELSNPQAHMAQLGSGTQSTYFSEVGTFSKIKRT